MGIKFDLFKWEGEGKIEIKCKVGVRRDLFFYFLRKLCGKLSGC